MRKLGFKFAACVTAVVPANLEPGKSVGAKTGDDFGWFW